MQISTGGRTLCCGTPRHCTGTAWPSKVQLHPTAAPSDPPCQADLCHVSCRPARRASFTTLQAPPAWPRAGVPLAPGNRTWLRQAQQLDRRPNERRHAPSMRSLRWRRALSYATNIDCAALLDTVRPQDEASMQQRCSGSMYVPAARECAARSEIRTGSEEGERGWWWERAEATAAAARAWRAAAA
jgi:hypothetical protein